MDDKTSVSVRGVLDKNEAEDHEFDFEEHSVERIDYENKNVNKEGDFCCRGNADTKTSINSEVQSDKKVDEDHVEVQTFIQGDLAEGKRNDEWRTKIIQFEAVKIEQSILSTTERLLKDNGNCADSKKNSAGIEDDDIKIDEELVNHYDEMDAPFGTRELLNLPFADYRESIIVESPVTSIDLYGNGSKDLQEEDVTNEGSNDFTDLKKCSEGMIENGKNFNENCLNETDPPIDHPVTSDDMDQSLLPSSRKSSFADREIELEVDTNSQSESCSSVDQGNRFTLLRNSVRRLERPLSVFAATVSVLLFMADIVTDCLLAGEYYAEAKMQLFYATLVFIIGPAVIISAVDLSWLFMDRKKSHSSKPWGNQWTDIKWFLALRVLLGLFSFGRIVRSVQYIYHYLMFTKIPKSESGKRRRERFYHKSRAKEERRDFNMLDFINAFTESGLQLMVQLFLFFQYDLNLDIIRVSSLCTSWISIAWTLVSYYNYNRDAISRKQALTLLGIGTCFIARASELAARITPIALFVTFFHFWGFFLVFHFLGMLLWLLFFSRPKLDDLASTKFGKFLYTILYAFVLSFCFINLEEKRTLKRMLVFYIILYSESFTMAMAVLINALQNDGIHSYKVQCLIIVPVGCVIHLVAQTVFYLRCHPTVSEKYQCSKCMPCR